MIKIALEFEIRRWNYFSAKLTLIFYLTLLNTVPRGCFKSLFQILDLESYVSLDMTLDSESTKKFNEKCQYNSLHPEVHRGLYY